MFDTIRNNSKILMGLLVVLIIPSFVLFGVDGYSNMSDRGAVVAKVGDIEITQQEWDAMHQKEVDRIRAGFAHELLQHACCAPFADDEPAALGFEISMQ